MTFRSLWMALILLTILAMAPPLSAKPNDGPPPGSFKLALRLKAEKMQGFSFDIRPTVVVLNDKEATINIHEDDESGLLVSLTVHPKRLGKDQVDLSIAFLVRQGTTEISRQTRFVTLIGQKGSFSVSDKKTGEHLELEVTPSLTK